MAWHATAMPTCPKPAAEQHPTLSWSCPLPPRYSPTRAPCSRPLTMPAFAGALPADNRSSTWRACPYRDHPGQHTAARGAPDRQHAPTPPHYPAGTAPVPPSPCTSPTKLARTPPVSPAPMPRHSRALHCPELPRAIKVHPHALPCTPPPPLPHPPPRCRRRGTRCSTSSRSATAP